MTYGRPEHCWRPSSTPDVSGSLIIIPDMMMYKSEERWDLSLIYGVWCLFGVLNESIDGRPVSLAEVSECGIATCGEGVALIVKA
jgi:hypothetical protein